MRSRPCPVAKPMCAIANGLPSGTRHGLIRPSAHSDQTCTGAAGSDALSQKSGLSAHESKSIDCDIHLGDGQYHIDQRGIRCLGQKWTEHDQSDHPGRKRCAGAESNEREERMPRETAAIARSLGRAHPTSSPDIATADLRPSAVLGILHANLSSRKSKRRWIPLKRWWSS